jgi:hypothetical protein
MLFSMRAADNGPSIPLYVQGEMIPDAQAFFTNHRVMAPLRQVAEALGAEVRWVSHAMELTIFYNGRYVWLQPGNPRMYTGKYVYDLQGNPLLTRSEAVSLPARPEIMDGVLYAPVAAVMEQLGVYAYWETETASVHMDAPEVPDTPSVVDTRFRTSPPPPEINPVIDAKILQMSTPEHITAKYEADEPFALLCFDSQDINDGVLAVLRAAQILNMRVYGLDTAKYFVAALPFAVNNAACLYRAHGRDKVEALYKLSQTNALEALMEYLSPYGLKASPC